MKLLTLIEPCAGSADFLAFPIGASAIRGEYNFVLIEESHSLRREDCRYLTDNSLSRYRSVDDFVAYLKSGFHLQFLTLSLTQFGRAELTELHSIM